MKNNSGSGINVSNIIVEYENEIVKTTLTASFSQSTIDATEGDASVDVPALTVKAGDKVYAVNMKKSVMPIVCLSQILKKHVI